MTYIVAFKMIDLVIVGLDELKSVLIISKKPKELAMSSPKSSVLALPFYMEKAATQARRAIFCLS